MPRSVVYMTLMYVFYLPFFMILSRGTVRATDVVQVIRERTLPVCAAALLAFTSYVLVLHTMQTAPISYITAIRQSSVLFALAFAVFALRERPGRLRLLGGLDNVAGVALIGLSH